MKPATRLLLCSLLLAPPAAALARATAMTAIPDIELLALAAPPSLWRWLEGLMLLVLLLAYVPLGLLAAPQTRSVTCVAGLAAAGWPLQMLTLAIVSEHWLALDETGFYLLMLATSCGGALLGWQAGRHLGKPG